MYPLFFKHVIKNIKIICWMMMINLPGSACICSHIVKKHVLALEIFHDYNNNNSSMLLEDSADQNSFVYGTVFWHTRWVDLSQEFSYVFLLYLDKKFSYVFSYIKIFLPVVSRIIYQGLFTEYLLQHGFFQRWCSVFQRTAKCIRENRLRLTQFMLGSGEPLLKIL